MRNPELYFVTAVMLLIASVALIIVGAVLQYQYGPGLGVLLFQTGRVLLVFGGAATIWWFKWSRGSKRSKSTAKAKRSRAFTFGMYAFWLAVAGGLVAIVTLQRQGRYFVPDDRLLNLALAVFPLLLAALVVAYFLVRHSGRSGPERRTGGPTKRTLNLDDSRLLALVFHHGICYVICHGNRAPRQAFP